VEGSSPPGRAAGGIAAKAATDGRERAVHRQVAVGSIEKLSALSQETGLVQERDFLLPPDEGKQASRMPTHDELVARYESVMVHPHELVSEAELAWQYGDQVAAEAAANAARGASRDDHPEGE
jgi:hypothetical protein